MEKKLDLERQRTNHFDNAVKRTRYLYQMDNLYKEKKELQQKPVLLRETIIAQEKQKKKEEEKKQLEKELQKNKADRMKYQAIIQKNKNIDKERSKKRRREIAEKEEKMSEIKEHLLLTVPTSLNSNKIVTIFNNNDKQLTSLTD